MFLVGVKWALVRELPFGFRNPNIGVLGATRNPVSSICGLKLIQLLSWVLGPSVLEHRGLSVPYFGENKYKKVFGFCGPSALFKKVAPGFSNPAHLTLNQTVRTLAQQLIP